MKLQEELRSVKEVFPAIAEMLEAAALRIEDQRQWRDAWLDAEKRVELLTRELDVLTSRLKYRKEKESND